MLAQREQKLLDREEAALRRERAYIGRQLALAELEEASRKREAALHRRAQRLGPQAEFVLRLTSPDKYPGGEGAALRSYEDLEVARRERLQALARREEALIARLDAISGRTRGLSAEEARLMYQEELLRVRDEEVTRMSRMLDEVDGMLAPSAAGAPGPAAGVASKDSRDQRVDEALRGAEPVSTAVPPLSPTSERSAELDAERRRQDRIGLKVYVGLESDHNFYTGFTQNISNGGLFIATHNPLPVGQGVELLFHLPTGHAIHTQGAVTWIRDYNERTPDIPPGMGVRFLDLAPDASALIRSFISDRDPMFYDED